MAVFLARGSRCGTHVSEFLMSRELGAWLLETKRSRQVSVGLLSALLLACSAEVDPQACANAAQQVDEFVEEADNQRCQADADCVVVVVSCAPLKTAYCGQVGMSREAYESARWQELDTALGSCSTSCEECLAALTAQCRDGLCYEPR